MYYHQIHTNYIHTQQVIITRYIHKLMASSYVILCLIISIMMLSVSYGSQVDNLQLVQSWIPTFCSTAKCMIPNLKQDFALHGVWPADDTGFTITKAHKNCVTSSITPGFNYEKLVRINQSGYIYLLFDMNLSTRVKHAFY